MVIAEEFIVVELDGLVAELWDKSAKGEIRSVLPVPPMIGGCISGWP